MNTKNVLLVEDDKFLSSLLKTRLEKEGINVIHVEDGEAALEVLKTAVPDLILLDLILPKKMGFEVMENLQQNPLLKHGPVVIISNLGQDADVAKGRSLGAIDYFIKAQTSIDDLVSKIKSFVGI
ncbi:MAG: response regulator [Patescibacteria group bacterium]|nr:response regulator [Patescibacteria group bacterium]MCL5261688.1 response regulator [Patescibacteria group bacterium]